MFQKLYTEDAAKNFVDFVQSEFTTIPKLMEWLHPILHRFGINAMVHRTINFNKVTYYYLWLTIDSNKSIFFVGRQFERNGNCITATVDFTDEQKSYSIFEEVGNKVKHYHEIHNQLETLQNDICELTKAL